MIDIHCHILPNFDDGAADLHESIAMARMAEASGVKAIVATPHFPGDAASFRRIGAMLGRFYFQKKYGKNWKKYIIVISAGYFVGAGLMSMLCVGVVFLSKASGVLPY